MLGHLILPGQNLLVEFRRLRVLKGQATTKHGIKDHPTTPDVHHDGFILIFAFDHLGRSVAGRPTGSLQSFLFSVSVGQTKVNNPDGLVIVDKQVLRLKIAMDYVEFVQVFDAADDLVEDLTGLGFGDPE